MLISKHGVQIPQFPAAAAKCHSSNCSNARQLAQGEAYLTLSLGPRNFEGDALRCCGLSLSIEEHMPYGLFLTLPLTS